MRQRLSIVLLLGWLLTGAYCLASPPPVITAQPTNTFVLKRDTASFSVVATSGTTLGYQWYFGYSAITGATNDTLLVANCTSNNAGHYYVAVRNAGGTVNSSKATLTVNYYPPVAADDAFSTTENTALTVPAPGVLANDSDPNADSMQARLVSGVSHGTLSLSTDGGFTYTPTANFNGTDSFTYQPRDSDGLLGNTVTVTLTVAWVDQAPVPENQNLIVLANTVANLTLTATDVDGQSLSYTIISGPTNGVLSGLNPATGALTYTPAANFIGSDAFTFSASDGTLSSTGQVRLRLMAPPSISTLTASNLSLTSATMNGTVNAQGGATTCYFRYGLSTNYGSVTAAVNGLTGSANLVSANLSGLIDGTLYHYCLVASNAVGVTMSPDVTFITSVGAPAGSSLSASSVTVSSAVLNSQVTQQLLALTCYYQYGETTNYGAASSSTLVPALGGLLGGGGLLGVSTPVSGLAPNTIYHYRLVLSGLTGNTYGPDASFVTKSLPPIQLSGGVSTSGLGATGKMKLAFTNTPGMTFTVLCSTNMVTWTVVGTMVEVSSGQYQFTDPAPATNPSCWYRIRSP